jgi:hypothetical protein
MLEREKIEEPLSFWKFFHKQIWQQFRGNERKLPRFCQ